MTRQPIQTAAARSGGKPLVIPVDVGEQFGGVRDYEFNPNLDVESINLMAAFVDKARSGDLKSQWEGMIELIEAAALDSTAERIAADITARALDFSAVIALGNALIEELTGANPTKRSQSPSGSPGDGETSTAGALLGVSMPPPSQPTG